MEFVCLDDSHTISLVQRNLSQCCIVGNQLVHIDNALVVEVDLAGTIEVELSFTYLGDLVVLIFLVVGYIDVVCINLRTCIHSQSLGNLDGTVVATLQVTLVVEVEGCCCKETTYLQVTIDVNISSVPNVS